MVDANIKMIVTKGYLKKNFNVIGSVAILLDSEVESIWQIIAQDSRTVTLCPWDSRLTDEFLH